MEDPCQTQELDLPLLFCRFNRVGPVDATKNHGLAWLPPIAAMGFIPGFRLP